MNKNFVPFELALKLKDLGFNEECFGWWNYGDTLCIFGDDNLLDNYAGEENRPIAPFWQQAFDWFTERHNIHSWITSKTIDDEKTIFIPHGREIPDIIKHDLIVDIIPYMTFEDITEARFACLKKLIEILENERANSNV